MAQKDFIRQIIDEDLETGRVEQVATRFPPEPNGYLHIGHAKSINLNFGIAEEYEGTCNLRFDDTNPITEEMEYVESIQQDVRWLGYEWNGETLYASDYFEQLCEWAEQLIRQGDAYVDSLTAEQISSYRGSWDEPGKQSPYRDRDVEENLDLFRRMRAGEFEEGEHVLRAKIDMASPNMNMRDPIMYRILKKSHHRTGDAWCIYPTYDWAHGQSDAVEGITHSICTLEFENHRPLYDWFLERIGVSPRPHQYEFARLELTYTILSKRKLLRLVQEKYVDGWDDPRMPTLSGIRRRGYPPEAVLDFCDRIGVSKTNSVVEIENLEYSVRQDLEERSPRAMGVLQPLKVVLTNYPEDQVEELEMPNHPGDESMGTRKVPFSRELYIDREDFMEDPPGKFYRLAPGRWVRLRWSYLMKCDEVVKDDEGNITELHCTYGSADEKGKAPDGSKVKGIIHWVAASHALDAEIRLYDRLFTKEDPSETEEGEDFTANLNPDSLVVLEGAKVEPSLKGARSELPVQFERVGYFVTDRRDSSPDALVFNRTVSLKDTWKKIQQKS
ncbi:MAG: glutamine--tRNA ligase/YqeY domain fusion protein [bacterium]